MKRLTPRLQVGLEYNPVVSEVLPIGNWVASPETDRLPLVVFGTSSDRIFTPEGNRAYYVTFAKGIKGLPLGPYVGLSYSEFERRVLIPFGLNVNATREIDILPMHDGRNTHLLLTRKWTSSNLTIMLVKMRHFGVSVGFGF